MLRGNRGSIFKDIDKGLATYHPPVPALIRRAHAKVNLALSVGPPEPAGADKPRWHPICSWMHAIDLADDLSIERAASSSYAIEWAADAPKASPIDWPIEADLAVRAHRLLESHIGRALPIRLELHKRIPVGGGLGGGSSDAAAVLVAVNTLFGLGRSPAELRAMSRSLGSDVGFFIDDDADGPARPAIVSGFGDRIERLERRRADRLLLLLPAVACATPAVYRAYDAAPRALRSAEVRAAAGAPGALSGLFNDLDGPAERVAPGLASLRRALAAALGRPIHMTGSGSTLLAIAGPGEDERALIAAASGVSGITPVVARLA
jgi:4-diphosphocytidyl-2-C-methyl-D-erythritol kinase